MRIVIRSATCGCEGADGVVVVNNLDGTVIVGDGGGAGYKDPA